MKRVAIVVWIVLISLVGCSGNSQTETDDTKSAKARAENNNVTPSVGAIAQVSGTPISIREAALATNAAEETLMAATNVQAAINAERTAIYLENQTQTATLAPEAAIMQKAEQGVSSNGEWVPYIKEIDGVEMVLVPAGCFMMGSSEVQVEAAFAQCEANYGAGSCSREYFEAELPRHEVCFDEPFWIDRYEITNAQFTAFSGQAGSESYWTDDDLPREQITWFEARDFCELREARLPTEAEWEYAARGPDARVYPWGDDFDGTLLNFCDTNCSYEWADKTVDDGYGNTAPVGSYDLGVSWVGALDMSGNVWEWTSSLYQSYPYKVDDGREL